MTALAEPRVRAATTTDRWRPFLDVTAVYVALSALVGWAVGWNGPMIHPVIVAGAITFALSLTGVTLAVAAVSRGWAVAKAEARAVAMRSLIIVGGVTLVSCLFAGWRSSIPVVHPFAWDARLDALDVAIHGTEPWRLTHAALRSPWSAPWLPAVVEWAYSKGWFLANVALALVVALFPVGPRSQRVLVAYVLQYAVLGSLVATLVSSAGPVFYGRIVPGPNPYAALMPSLRTIFPTDERAGVFAYQALLWREYVGGNRGLTTGITAFPSIHVSSAVLMALAAGSYARWAGVVGWLLALATLFGSVALGWHYAVDGYASVVGMLVLWWVAGQLVARSASNTANPLSLGKEL